jgi:hypothetical protein
MKDPYSINIQGLAHGCVDPHFADEYGERLICYDLVMVSACLDGWRIITISMIYYGRIRKDDLTLSIHDYDS